VTFTFLNAVRMYAIEVSELFRN